MVFGEIIKYSREQLLLSQENVATAIEKKYQVRLSASYLSMIENGARTNLTIKLINALLDFFNLPVQTTASLFCKPFTTDNSHVSNILETSAHYHISPSFLTTDQLALLPHEAKLCLAEFQAFIWTKYAKSSNMNDTK
jgi:transcriptional regulator with XRE-family HTH domain